MIIDVFQFILYFVVFVFILVGEGFKVVFWMYFVGVVIIMVQIFDGLVGFIVLSVLLVVVDFVVIVFFVIWVIGSVGVIFGVDIFFVYLIDDEYFVFVQSFVISGFECFMLEQGWIMLFMGELYFVEVCVVLWC